MSIDRRTAIRGMLTAGAAGAVSVTSSQGREAPQPDPDSYGMLYDTTRCIGCKACVAACRVANVETRDNPETQVFEEGIWDAPLGLSGSTKNVIHLHKADGGSAQSYMKRQCMHCVDPACVAACPFKALTKDGENGIVMWEASQCIGCRYCQVACPFEVPKFEWQNFNPRIVKCQLCSHRLPEGKEPACCEVCPTDAVIYGTRQDLLEDAKSRIAAKPELYYEQRVYGEHDGGGTQVLYLSHVPFSAIGLPDLPDESIAWYGTWVHGILYKWLLIPLIVYGLMAAVIRKRWHEHEEEAREEAKKTGLPQQI